MKAKLKRVLALILAMCMALSLLSTSVWASDTNESPAGKSGKLTVQGSEGGISNPGPQYQPSGGDQNSGGPQGQLSNVQSIADATVTLKIGEKEGTSFEYTGSAQTPEVTVKVGSETLTKDADYTITGDTSKTDAGKYTLTIEAVNTDKYTGTKDVEWEITPATPTFSCVALPLYETGSSQALLRDVQVTNGCKVYYSLEDGENEQNAIPTGKKAGTYEVYYRIDASDNNNYNDVAYKDNKPIEVKILAKPVLKLDKADGKYEYKATITPDVEGKAEGGSIVYKYAIQDDTQGATIWETFNPKATPGNEATTLSVGKYSMKAVCTLNGSEVTTEPVNFEVVPQKVTTVELAEDKDRFEWNDDNPAFPEPPGSPVLTVNDVIVKDADGNPIESREYTVTFPKDAKEPGEYTVTVTNAEKGGTEGASGNYDINGSVKYTIYKKTRTTGNDRPKVSMASYTYAQENWNGPTLVSTALDGHFEEEEDTATVTYWYRAGGQYSNDDEGWKAWPESATSTTLDAGSYQIRAEISETAHFKKGYTAILDFTVSKAGINNSQGQGSGQGQGSQGQPLQVEIESWTYGDKASDPSVDNPGNAEVTYTYYKYYNEQAPQNSEVTSEADGAEEKGGKPAYAGDYVVVATIAESANYAGATAEGKFKISKKTPKFGEDYTVKGLTIPFNGQYNALVEDSVTSGSGLEIVYSFSDDGANVLSSKPRKRDAREYNIWYKVKENRNYEDTGWLKVEPGAEITPVALTLDDWTYGDKPNAPSVSVKNGENANFTCTFTYSDKKDGEFTEKVPTDAGTYYVKATVVDKDGKEVEAAAGVAEFTIKQKEALLTWTNAKRTYNGKAQMPDAKVANVEEGDKVTVTVEGAQKDVGSYTAKATKLSNKNYKLPEKAESKFTIEQKEVGLKWSNTALTYNGKAQMPTAEATGLVDGDKITVTVTGAKTKAGSYTAKATKLSNSNYKLPEKAESEFTIAKKVVGLKWSKKDRTYNGKAQAPVATATGVVKGDKVKVTVAGAKTNAGSYTAKATKLSNSNYKLPAKTATRFAIAKAKQSAPAAPKVKKATISSITLKTESGLQYSMDGKTWQKSGKFKGLKPGQSYKFYARKAGNANYEASPASKATKAATLDDYERQLNTNLKLTEAKGNLSVQWGKVNKANRFEIYASYCGEKSSSKAALVVKDSKATSATIAEVNGKKVDLSKQVRVIVVAKNGDKVLAKSAGAHVVGQENKKTTNVKSVSLSKNAFTIEKGKTAQIKGSVTLDNEKLEGLSEDHIAKFRYISYDESVATVDESGKITAVGKGECVIHVFAHNGLTEVVNVTVK